MSDSYVDTDVIIRLLVRDDARKTAEAAALFESVEAGKLRLEAPVTVIADAVFVLSSPHLYHLARAQIRDLLVPLIRLPNFRVHDRDAVLAALDIYSNRNVDFGDAFIVASMGESDSDVV